MQTFATDALGPAVSVNNTYFFCSLNPSDTCNAGCAAISPTSTTDPALLPPNTSSADGATTTCDQQARFIKVVVQQRSLANALITVVGGPQIANTTAVATAGFTQTICQTLPLFICNPQESCTGGQDFNPNPGQELRVIAHSGSTTSPCASGASGKWAPGDYGFTNVPTGVQKCQGGKGGRTAKIEEFLATDQSLGCIQTGINPAQGDTTKAGAGMNVRLDIYDTQTLGNTADTCYPPAPDVTAGMIPDTSKTKPACFPITPGSNTQAFPFPHDTCLDTNTCATSRIGDGTWDITNYWLNNHGTSTLPAGLTASSTRYQVYQYEIANNLEPVPGTPAGHLENGLMNSTNDTTKQCFQGTGGADTASRRLINVGIVDCQFQNVHGASQTDVPPIKILQGFLANCVVNPTTGNKEGNCTYSSNGVAASTGDMYIEVVKVLQPNGSDGVLHNVVQLYR
jgi:hypothetical protein